MQTEKQTSSIEKHLELQVQMQASSNEKHNKQSKRQVQKLSKNKLSPVHIPATHSTSFHPLPMAISQDPEIFCFPRGSKLHSEPRDKAKTPVYSLQKLAVQSTPAYRKRIQNTMSKIKPNPTHKFGYGSASAMKESGRILWR